MGVHLNTGVRLAAALLLGIAAGCGKGKAPEKDGQETAATVLARVAGREIRQSDVDAALAQVPQFRRTEFQGTRGTMRLVNQLVDRELLRKAAEDAGIDRDPEVAKQLEDIRTGLLIQTYQRRLVERQPKPTEEQIKAYFDQHPEEFVIPARVNASWIRCATRADAERARRRIVDRGEEFGLVAREVSTDQGTARDGGLLGYFNPVGYVRSVGPDTSFTRRAFELEAGDVGEVFPYKGAWAFIKVHEKTSERSEPFERVQDRIRARLTPSFSDSLLESEITMLRGKYKVDLLIDADKELEGKSADDLMRLATEAGTPEDKIDYYRALLQRYPTYARADEAQFMIGFTYSEELQDPTRAKPEYEKVLANYPHSQIRESAQYMLQNMGQGVTVPLFETPPTAGGSPPGAGTP